MTQAEPRRIAGSYRDPSGYVAEYNGDIFRIVAPTHAAQTRAVLDTPLVRQMMAAGKLVETWSVDEADARAPFKLAPDALLLGHQRIERISYPYEWSFSLLRAAALLHLSIHIDLLECGLTLSDASAYNIQFNGPHPIFMDFLSIQPYREGQAWDGQRQFIEQFLAPLVLASDHDINVQSWLRGSPEGVPLADFARLLTLKRRLSPTFIFQVLLPARLHASLVGKDTRDLHVRPVPKPSLVALLRQLQMVIEALHPARKNRSTWADYEQFHNYDDADEAQKRAVVDQFCRQPGMGTLIDLGCNAGTYSRLALSAGVTSVIGVDGDRQALDVAYERALAENLNLLPLYQDLASPSPALGWLGTERTGFAERMKADGVLALALIHHLMIGRNLPVDQVVGFIAGFARRGIIEFVGKGDDQVKKLLAHRQDIFDGYTEDAVLSAIGQFARIEHIERLGSGNRLLIVFESR